MGLPEIIVKSQTFIWGQTLILVGEGGRNLTMKLPKWRERSCTKGLRVILDQPSRGWCPRQDNPLMSAILGEQLSAPQMPPEAYSHIGTQMDTALSAEGAGVLSMGAM